MLVKELHEYESEGSVGFGQAMLINTNCNIVCLPTRQEERTTLASLVPSPHAS